MVAIVVLRGWAELVAWMQERSAAGALDIETVWEHFRTLAATSEQAGLPALVARFDAAPAQDRLVLAATIAGMLGPVEWPVAWREPGRRLVRTIDEIIGVAELAVPSHGDEDPSLGDISIRLGQADLKVVRAMFSARCRRADLQIIAALCNKGTDLLLRRTDRLSTSEARLRLALALGAYAEAARAMNDACGVALFKYVDLRIKETSI